MKSYDRALNLEEPIKDWQCSAITRHVLKLNWRSDSYRHKTVLQRSSPCDNYGSNPMRDRLDAAFAQTSRSTT
jgi:hypothetical protein